MHKSRCIEVAIEFHELISSLIIFKLELSDAMGISNNFHKHSNFVIVNSDTLLLIEII